MKKSTWITVLIAIIVFLLSVQVKAETVGVFSEILKVDGFHLDDRQLYLVQETTVFIYSMKDFKLIKKFGKSGEGPEEFLGYAHVFPQPDHLMINSHGKISIFSKDGTFIKELKVPSGMGGGHFFQPMKDGYVGRKIVRENNVDYYAMITFDAQLNEIKEIYRVKALRPRKPGGKLHLFKRTITHRTYRGNLYASGKPGFHIDVVDAEGKVLYTVKHDYNPPKFTDRDEKDVRDYMKLRAGAQYAAAKDHFVFPQYFPEFYFFLPRDEKLYVGTWKRKDDSLEFLVFDSKGKLMKQVFVPFKFRAGLRACPLDIRKGKLYQVVENENEELELHVSTIDGV